MHTSPVEQAFQHRAQKDNWNNEVTIVTLPSNRSYRMVHHTERSRYKQRFTIYKGRGVFIKGETFSSANECQAETIKIAGYEMSWGDGDFLGITDTKGRNNTELEAVLSSVQAAQFDAVILQVLIAAEQDDSMWEHKEQVASNA